ncbi:hypothetical protein GCM10027425_10510 [Alteromonas gracilis]
MPDRLVLVGAGHAHLHLLRRVPRLRAAGLDPVLVAPAHFDYSGRATAVATGRRTPQEGRIDVARLTHGRLEHRTTRVIGLDGLHRTAHLADGTTLEWDVLSLNIGSVAARPAGVPIADGVIGVKPLDDLAGLRERLVGGVTVTVVGAGASGLELAGSLAVHPEVGRVRLIEAGPRIGATLPAAAAARVHRLLEVRGVEVVTGADLQAVEADGVTLGEATRLPHDIAVLATGLAAPDLARTGDLGGPDGFPVDAGLRHPRHREVHAVGDCADFLPGRLPRVGVHGVRQGSVLLAALEARHTTESPVYRPQRRALAILDLGGGVALAVRGRAWWLGRSSRWLKDRIDERWLAGYR